MAAIGSSLGSSPLNLTTYSNSTSTAIGSYINTDVNGTDIGAFVKSLFNDSTAFSVAPEGDLNNEQEPTTNRTIHDNDTYDTSIESIVSYTSATALAAMKLSYADFAYLRDVGVYPNNRMIVARRFATGVQDDLTSLGGNTKPIATLISWIPENLDNMKISFGEKWVDSEASYVSILNDIGERELYNGGDNKYGKMGETVKQGMNLVPFPGMMESLQYRLFKKLGLTDVDASNLPFGNPNLIRQAKQRKTIGNSADSGLSTDLSIEMEVVFEQKFISDIDPTMVFFDILANIITFATSKSEFQFNGAFQGKVGEFMKGLTSGTTEGFKKAVVLFVLTLADAIKEVGQGMLEQISNAAKKAQEIATTAVNGGDAAGEARNALKGVFDKIGDEAVKMIGSIISKYKVRIMGVTNALTGGPSTPWHVTIGNPKNPWFTSGDMLVDKVEVTLGNKLAFNDLPNTITAKFTMTPARPWGAQEIFRKFNSGKGRTYKKIDKGYNFFETKFQVSDQDISDAQNVMKQQTAQDKKDQDAQAAAAKQQTQQNKNNTTPVTDLLPTNGSNTTPFDINNPFAALRGNQGQG